MRTHTHAHTHHLALNPLTHHQAYAAHPRHRTPARTPALAPVLDMERAPSHLPTLPSTVQGTVRSLAHKPATGGGRRQRASDCAHTLRGDDVGLLTAATLGG